MCLWITKESAFYRTKIKSWIIISRFFKPLIYIIYITYEQNYNPTSFLLNDVFNSKPKSSPIHLVTFLQKETLTHIRQKSNHHIISLKYNIITKQSSGIPSKSTLNNLKLKIQLIVIASNYRLLYIFLHLRRETNTFSRFYTDSSLSLESCNVHIL